MLGQLIKNGFVPEQDLSHGWGALDGVERAKLTTWARAKMALMTLQKERAERPITPMWSMVQQTAVKSEVKAQNAWHVAQGKKLDLSKLDFLRPVD